MKYLTIALVLVIAPLLLFASFSSPFFRHNQSGPAGTLNLDRAWRLSSLLEDEYSGSAWTSIHQYPYIYSSQYPARMDTLKMYGWEDNAWALYALLPYTYDNTQEYITHLEVLSHHQGVWTSLYRNSFNYDNQHRLVYGSFEIYDSTNSVWINQGWTKIDYISNTNFTAWQYSVDATNRTPQWVKMTFTWDSQGRVIGETDQVSSDSLTWTNSEHYSRTYHPHDTTNGDIFVSRLSHIMPGQNMLQDVSNEDMFGMVSEELNAIWNGTAWVDTHKTVYTYNSVDKMITRDDQDWISNNWQINMQYDYIYDANYNLERLTKSYNQGGTLVPEKRYNYTWEQPTGVDDAVSPAQNDITLAASPNPFRGTVTLQLTGKLSTLLEIGIYNLKGQLVRSLKTDSKGIVSWDGRDYRNQPVAVGMYLARSIKGTQQAMAKMIRLQ